MSPSLQQLINKLDQLAPEEQWQVIGHLMNQLQHRAVVIAKPRKSWQEVEGVAPDLLEGVDAKRVCQQLA